MILMVYNVLVIMVRGDFEFVLIGAPLTGKDSRRQYFKLHSACPLRIKLFHILRMLFLFKQLCVPYNTLSLVPLSKKSGPDSVNRYCKELLRGINVASLFGFPDIPRCKEIWIELLYKLQGGRGRN